MNIVFTGMMGTGKTVVGKLLSKKLGMKYIDIDEMIKKDTEKSIKKIFENEGEKKFREIEKKAVRVVSLLDNYVISTGGGVVKDARNMEELKENSIIICLTANAGTIHNRTKKNFNRPLLNVKNPIKKINEILKKRAKFYENCDFMIDTSDKKIKEVAVEVIKFIERKKSNADKY